MKKCFYYEIVLKRNNPENVHDSLFIKAKQRFPPLAQDIIQYAVAANQMDANDIKLVVQISFLKPRLMAAFAGFRRGNSLERSTIEMTANTIKTTVQNNEGKSFDINDLTWEDVRKMFGTGRSFRIEGSRQEKKYGYRIGCMTKIGDIEESDWLNLIRSMIDRDGEQELFTNLLTWVTENDYTQKGKKDLEKEALELFASRIFDSTEWCDFVAFNTRFRPEVVSRVPLVLIKTTCCSKEGQTTQAIIDRWGELVPCPICGRFSTYVLLNSDSTEKEK